MATTGSIPGELLRLLDVAQRFLRKKATISDLRAAVREAENALNKAAPTDTRDSGQR